MLGKYWCFKFVKICCCLFLLVGGQLEGDPVSQCCVAQSLQQGAISEMGGPKQGRERRPTLSRWLSASLTQPLSYSHHLVANLELWTLSHGLSVCLWWTRHACKKAFLFLDHLPALLAWLSVCIALFVHQCILQVTMRPKKRRKVCFCNKGWYRFHKQLVLPSGLWEYLKDIDS